MLSTNCFFVITRCLICLSLLLWNGQAISAQVVINELSASNQNVIEDEFGESADWIELYNAGEEAVELAGMHLSDDLSELDKWRFPNYRLEPATWVLIFASDRDLQSDHLHTNFKLSADGEAVVLSQSDGEILDQIIFPALPTDHSMGRLQDGSPDWAVFTEPSPGSSNDEASGSGFSAPPEWNTVGHFFAQPTFVELSHPDPEAELYFTRDGSLPDVTDERYTGPIAIDTTTALRCIALSPGLLASPVSSRTFFIGARHDIGVISIMGNPAGFWSYENGILVDGGPHADPEWPHYGANFWSDRKEPVHVEFFTANQELGIAFRADTRVHGGRGARTNPMKPLRLLIDKKYGSSTLDYPFFPDREQTTYNRLVLRNASGDYNNAHLRDAFLARYFIKNNLNLDVLAHRPHALYINGAYYGLMNLREKSDEYYLQYQYGIPAEDIDLLEEDTIVVSGDFTAFNSMHQFVMEHDMREAAHFAQAATYFDVENIAEGFIVQSALNNGDWLHNNTKYWRERKADARWRYLIFDLDIAMARHGWSNYDRNNLGGLLHPLQGHNRHADLFLALLANDNYRHYFINRYADLLNTVFHPTAFAAEVDQTVDEIDTEMPRHFGRWGWPGYDKWRNDRIPKLYEYLENRPAYAREDIREFFGLSNEVSLRLQTVPAGAGRIQISTIQPGELPWEGIYFNEVPVRLTVVPNEGFRFQHWQSEHTISTPDASPDIRYTFAQDDKITAYFVAEEAHAPLTAFVNQSGTLTVDMQLTQDQSVSFQLFDMQGRLLQTYIEQSFVEGTSRIELNLPRLAAATYVVQAQLDGVLQQARFFVL